MTTFVLSFPFAFEKNRFGHLVRDGTEQLKIAKDQKLKRIEIIKRLLVCFILEVKSL